MKNNTISIQMDNHYIEEIKEINKNKVESGEGCMTFLVKTFGCQMNEHDSEKIIGMLEAMSFQQVSTVEEADVVLFLTCCVRESAEEKIFGHIGELNPRKKNWGDKIIAIGGCMTQQPHIVDKIKKSYRHVSIVFGTYNLHAFPQLLYKQIKSKKRIFSVQENEKNVTEGAPVKRDNQVKAFINIMYGCNNFCSYCIVPYVRGRERSREIESIVIEAKELSKSGYKEITILGQNVNSFGNDRGNKDEFSKLLVELNKIDGIERIRFMTSHPKDLSDSLIETMAACDKICNNLHLPFQAGSDSVLKSMNRHYTKENYINLIDKIKEKNPGITFSTDIIVGFPGETEDDFQETLDVVMKVRFEQAFMFMYSKRSGTPAAKMETQVTDEDKKDRHNRLCALQSKISEETAIDYDNNVYKVLCEGRSKNSETMYTGRTETNRLVNFSSDTNCIGKIVNVKITKVSAFWLEGMKSVADA